MSRIDTLLTDVVDQCKGHSTRQNWCTYIGMAKYANITLEQAKTMSSALSCNAVMVAHPGSYGYEACKNCIGHSPRLNQWLEEIKEIPN